jgi:hypothetical protein
MIAHEFECAGRNQVRTVDEMLVQRLLTPAQHHEIRAWISAARTPDAIMQMPAGLWRSLELASVLMGVDADLSQPPCFDLPLDRDPRPPPACDR